MIGAVTFGQMWRADDRQRRGADHPRRVDELALADRQRLRPGQPGDGRRGDDADRDHHLLDAGPERRRDPERQDQARERLDGVHDPHDTSSSSRRRSPPAARGYPEDRAMPTAITPTSSEIREP